MSLRSTYSIQSTRPTVTPTTAAARSRIGRTAIVRFENVERTTGPLAWADDFSLRSLGTTKV